jgi:hypothetical protein
MPRPQQAAAASAGGPLPARELRSLTYCATTSSAATSSLKAAANSARV